MPIPLYAYKLGHRVSHQVTSRTNIKLANEKKGHFHFEQIGQHPLTRYNIIIDNPSALGFSQALGGEVARNRIQDLILSMNLELTSVALSTISLNLAKYEWPTSNGNNSDGLAIKEHVNALLGMGRAEWLDTIAVEANLRKIDKLDRHKHPKNINQTNYRKKSNLRKALSEYELVFDPTGRREIDKVSLFRSFSIVIELAINWEKELSNTARDSLLTQIRIPLKTASERRQLYPRTKHIDKHLDDQKQYRKIQDMKFSQIATYRSYANKVLLNRLAQL
jgi:hypothetical protein